MANSQQSNEHAFERRRLRRRGAPSRRRRRTGGTPKGGKTKGGAARGRFYEAVITTRNLSTGGVKGIPGEPLHRSPGSFSACECRRNPLGFPEFAGCQINAFFRTTRMDFTKPSGFPRDQRILLFRGFRQRRRLPSSAGQTDPRPERFPSVIVMVAVVP